MKHLGINLTKHVWDMCANIYKNAGERNQRSKYIDIPYHGLKIWHCKDVSSPPNWYINLIKFLSKSQKNIFVDTHKFIQKSIWKDTGIRKWNNFGKRKVKWANHSNWFQDLLSTGINTAQNWQNDRHTD